MIQEITFELTRWKKLKYVSIAHNFLVFFILVFYTKTE